MTQKTTYWLADADGHLIAAEGADERDRLAAAGWTVTEPTSTAQVWLRYPATGHHALFAFGSVEVWRAKGWEPVVPPTERTDVGISVVLPDTAPAAVIPAASLEDPTPATTRDDGQKTT